SVARSPCSSSFVSHAPSATEIYTLSLHDALPISGRGAGSRSFAPAALRMTGALAPRREKREAPSDAPPCHSFLLPNPRGAVILSERATARERRIPKQILRACGAQDDRDAVRLVTSGEASRPPQIYRIVCTR